MDDDFDQFCRQRFERINKALELLGIESDESFESYKIGNYEYLESIYINSMSNKTIH